MFSVPIGRVIFEIGGTAIREELARDSMYFFVISLRNLYKAICSPPSSRLQVTNENGIHQQVYSAATRIPGLESSKACCRGSIYNS
jgi:hypothetical protein